MPVKYIQANLIKTVVIILCLFTMYSGNSYAKDPQKESATDKLFLEAKTLYLELLQFKNNEEFLKVGFDPCCSFNKWLVRAEALRDHPDGMNLIFKGFFPGDLEKLGKAYFESQGEETEYTKKETRRFRQVFNLLNEDEYKPNPNEALNGVRNFEKVVFTASPQFKNIISSFDISYSDGHLIMYIKQSFLNMDSKSQKKAYNAVSDLWKSTNLVREKQYSDRVEVKYHDLSSGETKSISLN